MRKTRLDKEGFGRHVAQSDRNLGVTALLHTDNMDVPYIVIMNTKIKDP